MEEYIKIIDGGTTFGVGFFVGNLFITAGHIFESGSNHSISHRGKKIPLNKADALFYCPVVNYDFKTDGYDLAIFQCGEINSPLELATENIFIGQTLQNMTIRNVNSNASISSIFDQHISIEAYKCTAEVTNSNGFFGECNTHVILKEGDSGSPFFKDNKVFGFLVAGEPDTPRVIFQTARSVNQIILQIQ